MPRKKVRKDPPEVISNLNFTQFQDKPGSLIEEDVNLKSILFTFMMNLAVQVRPYVGMPQLLTIGLILGAARADMLDEEEAVGNVDDDAYFEVVAPQDINFSFKLRYAKDFGPVFKKELKNIGLVPTLPPEACTRILNTDDVRNNIALIVRGECSFLTKAVQAEAAGAAGLVVADSDAENDYLYVDMVQDGTKREVTIPAGFLLGKDGARILRALKEQGLKKAVINIPLNTSNIELHRLRLAPWNLW